MRAATFTQLREFAARAEQYRQLRAEHPTARARDVHLYVTERLGDPWDSFEQATCRHVWNMSAGEADEAFLAGEPDSIRCVYCGKDGDA